MPSKHTLNVSLTGELCEFIAAQVASGRFRTSSEVVRAALRLLERDASQSQPSSWPGLTKRPLTGAKVNGVAARSRSPRS
ncbi:type II toxin-antitoxin system ParD family antitoxin [Bradyrhizobium sp. RDM4]|uniref:type II toxin-antitoxin system ParD family antitoxin n=1 Tax=Bradyrhizobium sp. RDM4 TaxID=3378765 RepID=UPI0038FC7166